MVPEGVPEPEAHLHPVHRVPGVLQYLHNGGQLKGLSHEMDSAFDDMYG